VVIDAVAKLIKAGADVYEGMIVGIVVVLAVTLTQFRQLLQSGREFFPGMRGALAIPTLALTAGLLAMMASANVDLLKGRTLTFGLSLGLIALVALSAIKFLESRKGAA
jgi:hypothetical protein